ncbi:MAG: ATP-binding cassette domain-containing protein, partial [Candidatus Gastranaerophilales bacterium]|nr:ATP-binding cassette domain-containing protein [Candidatus Gastranaerophilales bacterium]
FKNIYMYFFANINSTVLQDISVDMALRIIKHILCADFVAINSIPNSEKQGILAKTGIIVWGYLIQYINLITNIAIIIMLLIFLLIKFTLPAVVAFCFISVLSFFEYKILKHKSSYQNKYFALHFDALTKLLYVVINASKEIRLNNKSSDFINQSREKYQNIAQMNKKSAINNVFHIYFTEISIMATFIIVLFVLYYTTDFNNQTLITTLGAIIAVILRITPAVNRSQSAIYGINSNENIVRDVIKFDKQFILQDDFFETDEKLPFENEITIKDISYSYDKNNNGLQNINLKIKKGEFIGIVGPSGCYKTTLSLIISGLIKPDKGKIYVDKNLIDEKNAKKWQNNISILSQDFSIIKDNIFEGLNNEIIEKLELKDFDFDPLKLSFGQKQRTALAHNLAQNKDVIILDEATSSLDVLSEEKINNILLDLKGKKTMISIAHRLQILKHCDKILYMNKGKIIDCDTFINLYDKYDSFKTIIELSNFKLR